MSHFLIPRFATLVLPVLLVGCTSNPPSELSEGPTVAEIYARHASPGNETSNVLPRRSVHHGSGDLSGYTRTSRNELNQLFYSLPNPTLCTYVFPHLSPENSPVPGYTTCWKMYQTTQWALPGEVLP